MRNDDILDVDITEPYKRQATPKQSKKLKRFMRMGTPDNYIGGMWSDFIQQIKEQYKVPKDYKSFISFNSQTIDKFDTKYCKVEDYNSLYFDKRKAKVIEKFGFYKYKNIYGYKGEILMADSDYFVIFFAKSEEDITKAFGSEVRIPKINNGLYKIEKTQMGMMLAEVQIDNTLIPILNEGFYENIMLEINEFQKNKKFYDDNNMDYKRGFMFYGEPGNGKTTFIRHLVTNVDAISITCNIKDDSHLDFIFEFLQNKMYKDKFKIIIVEDIDGMDYNNRSEFLNLLDGVGNVSNVIFLATTNYPHKVDDAIMDRPSRIDSIYYISPPEEQARKKLINMYFKKLTPKVLEEAVEKSKDFKSAYFKEIYILSEFYKCDIIKAMDIFTKKRTDYADFTKKDTANYCG